MKEIFDEVSRISGRQGKGCYYVLSCAVKTAMAHMPEDLSMKDLCEETGFLCRKNGPTVCKALSRAARDVWEYGDRQALAELLHHTPFEKPSPKDLVTALSQTLWTRHGGVLTGVEYHLLESHAPKKYGLWGRSFNPDAYFVVAPYSEDRQTLEHLVERLNQNQTPLRELKALYLEGVPALS